MLLRVRELRTYFYIAEGVVKAVDGISYEVAKGETIAIVGESGCGKSVSALSILRLIPQPPGKFVSGEVLFDGEDLLQASEERLREVRGNSIGMIFQEPMTSLNPVLTIGRQLTEVLLMHLKMNKHEARQRSAELLQLVGLSDASSRVNAYPHEFSAGMRQRVMIAMALSCNPKLLIADEPTAALDVTIQAQLLELIKKLSAQFGMALILITHNLGVVARYASRVNIMYAGRIVEAGSAEDIYYDPRHPYTIALLASVPRLDETWKAKLSLIKGLPPDPVALPLGCAFQPRCIYCVAKCYEETPRLVQVRQKHEVACWVNTAKSRI